MMMTIAAVAVFGLVGCNGGTENSSSEGRTAPANSGAKAGGMANEPSTTTKTPGGTTGSGATKGGTTDGGAANTGTTDAGAGSDHTQSGGGH